MIFDVDQQYQKVTSADLNRGGQTFFRCHSFVSGPSFGPCMHGPNCPIKLSNLHNDLLNFDSLTMTNFQHLINLHGSTVDHA